MKCRKLIAVCLAGLVLCSPVLALPSPEPSSSGVWLSDAEAAEMEAAIKKAQEALQASSDKIAKQEKDLQKLSMLCAALVGVLVLDAAAHVIIAIKQ